MPQKRNPDAAELVRAKTGRIAGALEALLIVMKGLPLAYQKDMQEDKEGAMAAFSALLAVDCRHDRHGARHDARRRAHARAAGEGYSTATDLADWLVRKLKMPFREAHHVTGRIVAQAAAGKFRCTELPLAAMQAIETRITKDVLRVLSVDNSVKSRVSHGGTAPRNVRREAKRWLKALAKGRVNAADGTCHAVAAAVRSDMVPPIQEVRELSSRPTWPPCCALPSDRRACRRARPCRLRPQGRA